MEIHFNKMSDQQKLDWLRTYEKQNPKKYLSKFGKIIGRVPLGQPFAGQPNEWEYVAPEEALKKISPSYALQTGGVKVEIGQAKEIEMDFAPEPDANQSSVESKKRGRKPNV